MKSCLEKFVDFNALSLKILLKHSHYLEFFSPENHSHSQGKSPPFQKITPIHKKITPIHKENHPHSQGKLYEEIVCKTYIAHNSLEDVIALSTILQK